MLCGVHVAAAVVDGVAVRLAVLARRLVLHAVALPTHPATAQITLSWGSIRVMMGNK